MGYSTNPRIDLHIHSNYSDGTLSPKEILTLAQRVHLSAIAITDHDTVDGNRELAQGSISSTVKTLTGVELSTIYQSTASFTESLHILGYAIDLDHPRLLQTIQRLKRFREDRVPKILRKLAGLGLSIQVDELERAYGRRPLGRPHIAYLMVKKGFVASIDDAFDRFLGKGQPAFVPKERICSQEAIEVIRHSGGIPVLAHPGLFIADLEEFDQKPAFEKLMQELKSYGIMGIEGYYSEHTDEQTLYFKEVARKLDLIVTGGTDFHGSIKPEIKMGYGKGNLEIPFSIYTDLVNAVKCLPPLYKVN